MNARMLSEIWGQGEAWDGAITAVAEAVPELLHIEERHYSKSVRFLGAGSSYHLGLTARAVWAQAGMPTMAVPASEQILHKEAYSFFEAPMVVAASRSGRTTETLEAVRMLASLGSPTIGITVTKGSPLAQGVDVPLIVGSAAEESIVQTKSFSGQLLAAEITGMVLSGNMDALEQARRLPDLATPWLRRIAPVLESVTPRYKRVYFLGTGSRWGLALEGALKLKETALCEAEGFQFLEFRHGPKSMIDEDTLVVGLVSESARSKEIAVLRESGEYGAQVMAIGENLEAYTDQLMTLSFESGLDERLQDVLFLPPLHLLAYNRAKWRGLDPDKPRHLTFAVELSGREI